MIGYAIFGFLFIGLITFLNPGLGWLLFTIALLAIPITGDLSENLIAGALVGAVLGHAAYFDR